MLAATGCAAMAVAEPCYGTATVMVARELSHAAGCHTTLVATTCGGTVVAALC